MLDEIMFGVYRFSRAITRILHKLKLTKFLQNGWMQKQYYIEQNN